MTPKLLTGVTRTLADGPVHGPDHLTAARAEALFASDLSARGLASGAEVAAAVSRAVRTHGGVRGCAGEVAAAYGDCAETAATRMRWALHLVEVTYRWRAGAPPPTARRGSNGTGPSARPTDWSRP